MKNLLVDTNIVIDLLAERHPHYFPAASLFSKADKNEIKLHVSSLTLATTHYILTQQKSYKEAKAVLRNLKLIINILPLDDKITELALNDNLFNDFEDGLQYFSAIENEMECIITRNLKDFKHSKLPVMNAQQFLESLA